jgi:NhaP-type Na+/H+ or K+/H+ antiporter
MSLTDFILSFWKHKKILIFILFLSVIFSILLESFILKKSKIDIELRNKDLINFQIYPSGMTTLSFYSEKE